MAKTAKTVAVRAPIDLNHVATFVRVAEAGSFTAAAAAAGVLKSSVSRSVAALEVSLGVRLLQRTTRSLHLTDAGQAYYTAVREAISGIRDATAQATEAGREPQGLIRLTAPEGFDALAEILGRFLARYPKIRLDISLTGRRVDLVEEGFDLALRAGALPDSSLVARKITDLSLGLYASKRYLRAHGKPTTVAELAQHRFILLRAPQGRATLRLHGPAGIESVEVSGWLSADELSFVWESARVDLGLALLPGVPNRPADLVRVLPQYGVPGGGFYVVIPSARHEPTRVALLRETLVKELRVFFGA